MLYLLHSTVPLVRSNGRVVRHYLGYCRDDRLEARLKEHKTSHNSSKLLQAMRMKGATFLLAKTWPGGTPTQERRLKQAGHLAVFCPLCAEGELRKRRRVQKHYYYRSKEALKKR